MNTAETDYGAWRVGGKQKSIMPTDHGEEKTPPDFDNAPDGGPRAWLVATGVPHQLRDQSSDKITWIGSLAAFLQFAVGTISGPLFDRFGAWLIRPAAVLYILSIMMMSLCHEYWQFMLAQGVLMGIAMGLLTFPAMAAVSQYFDKKRAAALGLAISGSSMGGVVIPIALSKMLNSSSLGFGWTVRVIGFIMLPLLAFSCVAIKSRLPLRTTTFFIGAAFKEANFVLLTVSVFFMFLGMFTPLFFIPTYAVTRGMDATLASYLLAILNAASTFGRIIPGVLADKFGRMNVLAFGGIITGIIIFCLNKAESTPALVLYSVAFGFSSGSLVSGAAAALSVCPKDPRDIGTYIGMGVGISSLAALIGPPANGALVVKYGGFFEVSIFSGVMCFVGGCIALASKAAHPKGIIGRT